jgi:hypothetical protein
MALLNVLSPSTWARLTGFATGAAAAGIGFAVLQRQVWRDTTEACMLYGKEPEPVRKASDEYVWGPKTRALMVQTWNRTIDKTVGFLAAGGCGQQGLCSLLSLSYASLTGYQPGWCLPSLCCCRAGQAWMVMGLRSHHHDRIAFIKHPQAQRS